MNRDASDIWEMDMIKIIVAAGALALALPAAAQTSLAPTSPLSPPVGGATQTPNQGSPAIANSGPGSTGTVSREGTGAGTVSNNSAGASNAGDPAQANPTPSSSR